MSLFRHAGRTGRRAIVRAATLLAAAAIAGSAVPVSANQAGFTTSVAPMLMPGPDAPPGVEIVPMVTVGDRIANFTFDSIPDGISIRLRGQGRADLYVNHETSLVPFPVPPTVPVPLTDYTNSHVDLLSVNQHSGGILHGRDAIPSDANYQRFCSNFLAGPEQGFDRWILFTNEEATDIVNRVGLAWPTDAGGSQPEQAGVVVALDVQTGQYRTIYGMGRHNHENSVALPGFEQLVVWSGDDTFSAPASQLYSYVADDTDAVWNDEGALYAFKADDETTNDYGDLSLGETVSGTFIPVPEDIATGPQGPLETWSNANNVFQFIRIEDIAYDRTDPNVVYVADTGEPRALPDATTGRLRRGPSGTAGPYPNGRIFKFVVDETDPLTVTSLSILIDADTGGAGNAAVIHQPDNLETTANSLLIQEDPGSHNQFAVGGSSATGNPNARVWRYDLGTGTLKAVLEVDQSLDETAGYDFDAASKSRAGAWESSGIVDASSVWGPGWFLIDVQAATLIIQTEPGTLGDEEVIFEREGGQLLRVYLPGA